MSDLAEVNATLRELLKWIRVQAIPTAKEALQALLTKREYRVLYAALDGRKTQKQLSEISGMSQPRISQMLTVWQRAGIVEEVSSGKYNKLFDPADFGLEETEKENET